MNKITHKNPIKKVNLKTPVLFKKCIMCGRPVYPWNKCPIKVDKLDNKNVIIHEMCYLDHLYKSHPKEGKDRHGNN